MVRTRKLRSSASLRRRPWRLDEPQRQPIAAGAAFVVHVAGKTAHQMDAHIADLCLLEGSCRCWRRCAGGIELAAVVLDAGDQDSVIALKLDGNLERIVLERAIHDDIGDGLFEAKLHGENYIGRG